jgi:hypothetical protein
MLSATKSRATSPFNIRSFQYIGTGSKDGGLVSSHTFTNISLGQPYPRQYLILGISFFELNSGAVLTSGTTINVDGINASNIVPRALSDSNSYSSMWALDVSNKSTISNLTITPSMTVNTFIYGLWLIKSIKNNNSPFRTLSYSASTGTTSYSIDTQKSGALVVHSMGVNASTSSSGPGMITNFSYDARSTEITHGASVYPTNTGTFVGNAILGSSPNSITFAIASFN